MYVGARIIDPQIECVYDAEGSVGSLHRWNQFSRVINEGLSDYNVHTANFSQTSIYIELTYINQHGGPQIEPRCTSSGITLAVHKSGDRYIRAGFRFIRAKLATYTTLGQARCDIAMFIFWNY